VWSPNGQRIAYWNARTQARGLYWRASDGSSEERLTSAEFPQIPGSFSPDGRWLAFVELRPGMGGDIYALDMTNRATPKAVLSTPYNEQMPDFSPDVRWLAYVSDETGEPRVSVVPYGRPGRKIPISSGRGIAPRWRKDGRELLYSGPDALMSVSVDSSSDDLHPGSPRVLMRVSEDQSGLAVAPDAGSVVVRTPETRQPPVTELDVVLDWIGELKAQLPAK